MISRRDSMTWLALLTCALALAQSGCGKKSDLDPPNTERNDASVVSWQGQLLDLDRRRLAELDSTSVALVRDEGSTPTKSLTTWIDKRVKKIIGNVDLKEHLVVLTQAGEAHPAVDSTSFITVSRGETMTAMTNLGAAIYRAAKQENSVYGFKIGGGVMRIDSPRAGLIQINDGLFNDGFRIGADYNSAANSLLRLATLFHEARHGDGNGDHAGFPHIMCPAGDPNRDLCSAYAGKQICDDVVNGPYAVGASTLESLIPKCKDCSPADIPQLNLRAAEFRARICKKNGGSPAAVDDRPETMK